MSNDVTSSFVNDVKSICDTQKDSLYDRLSSPSVNYARISLYTNGDSLNKDDADLIQFNDSIVLELIKNKYRDMSDIFNLKECNIYVFADAFYIVPNPKTGVTADRNRLIVDYLHLNKKTRDISDHFKIDSRLNVTEVENQYFLNLKRDDIQTQNHYFTTTQNSGYYSIQAARIIIDTIKICTPNDESKSLISYQGNLNTDDGSTSVSLAENGYLLAVPAKSDFVNSWIDKEYDKKHYNYEWEFYPSSHEMSAEHMINLLDQDISVNSKNSYVYGYNQYYEIDLIIPPPKGFASLAKFSYKKAIVKTRDDKMVNTYFNMNIPDFSFLPLEIITESNN